MAAALHEALACLRPKDFDDVPTDRLDSFLPDILAKAECIANSVPPPPDGTPYPSAQRTRKKPQPAVNAKDLTISDVRRPKPNMNQRALQKLWGKPLRLGAQDAATGMSVFKMAGHDKHGAWFARSAITEGLGFENWKQSMLREFPESLEVQGGPGEGNVRGIGGDQRLEELSVDGLGKLEVYQLSAQFPGPTSPREFITLLITSENCLTDASKVGDAIPRHLMVVSIPVAHPEAPPRNGMVRGYYESIEMIREIPLSTASGTNDDPESNPVEWIMVTRSDPGGGIPRFMVERNVPSSIVQDAIKFLDWACARSVTNNAGEAKGDDTSKTGELQVPGEDGERKLSRVESNGITAGVGTSIADRPSPSNRRLSHQANVEENNASEGLISQLRTTVEDYIPNALNPLHPTSSSSSSSTSSSIDSFASAEQFRTASDRLAIDNRVPTPSIYSQTSLPMVQGDSLYERQMQKLDEKRQRIQFHLDHTLASQDKKYDSGNFLTEKQAEKAAQKHRIERKKQEDTFHKQMHKLEKRRIKETKNLLCRQQKEADTNQIIKLQNERNEHEQRASVLEEENKLLKEQIGALQKENTAIVARLGKTDTGRAILRIVKEEDIKSMTRASPRASISSGKSKKSRDPSDGSSISRSGTRISLSS